MTLWWRREGEALFCSGRRKRSHSKKWRQTFSLKCRSRGRLPPWSEKRKKNLASEWLARKNTRRRNCC